MILASGESQVDAVTASGLAGNLNAPVLLTRSSRLPHNVARFIDEQNITDVVIVGGTAAVSDAVVTALESLGSRPSVQRISGADRYATAAAIGSELGGPNPTWCGSSQSAAILVNGGDDGRADAVISGPMAFRLGLPILLTMADEVPDATASFLTDNKVERVVVVGGMGAVSASVVNTLTEDVGVVNVQRISGGSAAATSVMVAKEMLGNCAAVLQTNKDLVALVNRDATADGIAAAPVLGRGLGAAGSVPILLVSDELPAAVNDYLASTAEVDAAGSKTHLSIVAIGGTAVVSGSVMEDAKAAAKTSSALTATIAPVKYKAGDTIPAGKAVGDYSMSFTVTFSDNVKVATDADSSGSISAAEARGTVGDPTLYRVNGRRIAGVAVASDGLAEPISLVDLIFTADRTVTITLSHHLEAGDTISVAGGDKVGSNMDQRKLEAASMTLPAVSLPTDRTAPVVEIVAVAGQSSFHVIVSEPNVLHSELVTGPTVSRAAGSNWRDFVMVQGQGAARAATTFESASTTAPTDAATVGRKTANERYTVTVDQALAAGDVITIERKAILDKGGRGNALTRYTVPKVKTNTAPPAGTGNFEVQSVSIGNYAHTAQAAIAIATSDMTVTAKAGGVAAGAAGNGWRIFGYDDRSATGNAFNIDVAVDIANQRISYTISDVLPLRPFRAPQIGDLASALVSNTDFAGNFSVSYVDPTTDSKTDALTATDPAGLALIGGMSAVGVVVKFNDALQAVTGADLAGDIAPRFTGTPVVTVQLPDNQVHISYTSGSMAELPTRSGFRVIAAGVATAHDGANGAGVTNVREILNSLRPNASIKP